MDLRRLITVFRTWLPFFVVTMLLAGGTAFVVSSLQQKTYEAKATLIVGQSLLSADPDYNQLLAAQGLSGTYAAIAETGPILQGVIDALGLQDTPAELVDRVRVDAPRSTSFVIISAQDSDPARAAAIANELGDQLIDASPAIQGRATEFQQSIDRDLAATQELIAATQARAEALTEQEVRTPQEEAALEALEGRLVSLRSTYATLLSFSSEGASNVLTVVEPAGVPSLPVSPTTLLNTLLAAALGLLVVAGIAFLAEQLDDSIKDADTVQEVVALSTLGTIGRMRSDRGRSEIYQMVTLLYPRSSYAEAYRSLRANVEFASVDAPVRTLLVTSATEGEGKTVTTANLAVAFAQAGRRVLLVDADLRKPALHLAFGLPNASGLTTMLRSDSVNLDAVTQTTEQANLRVLTTGPLPPNPAELLGSHRMQAALPILQQSADLVIFDSPPLQAVTDSAVISSYVDGTLLVIDASRSRRRAVRLARETLARAGADVLGVVLNRVAVKEAFAYGGYYGGSKADAAGRPLVPAGPPDQGRPAKSSGPS